MADQVRFTSKLHESHILVVGGSAGVGYAVAEASIEQGAAAVVISSSNPTRLEHSVARLRRSYPLKASRISGFACDLSQEDELETNIVALLDAATDSGTQKLDHIAYTAGDTTTPKPLGDVELKYIKESFLVRSFAAMLLVEHASKYLAPGPGSSFTLTFGTASVKPNPGWPALTAVTSSVKALAAALALDLRPTRDNTTDKTTEEKVKLVALTVATTATGAIGKPEDEAEAYIYFMRDHNITGTSIDTNSGQLLL